MFDTSETILVEKAVAGDVIAFEALDNKYRPKLRNVVRHHIHNKEDVEDITQITLLAAFNAIQNFRSESCFFTWLFSIAINNIRKFSNRKSNQEIHMDDVHERDYHDGDIINHTYSDPENIYIASQTQSEIIKTVMNLPDSLRTSFFLREIECLSYAEISKKMGCPIGTVRSRIHRARAEFSTIAIATE